MRLKKPNLQLHVLLHFLVWQWLFKAHQNVFLNYVLIYDLTCASVQAQHCDKYKHIVVKVRYS